MVAVDLSTAASWKWSLSLPVAATWKAECCHRNRSDNLNTYGCFHISWQTDLLVFTSSFHTPISQLMFSVWGAGPNTWRSLSPHVVTSWFNVSGTTKEEVCCISNRCVLLPLKQIKDGLSKKWAAGGDWGSPLSYSCGTVACSHWSQDLCICHLATNLLPGYNTLFLISIGSNRTGVERPLDREEKIRPNQWMWVSEVCIILKDSRSLWDPPWKKGWSLTDQVISSKPLKDDLLHLMFTCSHSADLN